MNTLNRQVAWLSVVLLLGAATNGCAGSASTGNASGSSSVTLSWDAPTSNVDGSALGHLAGYKIYYGTSSGRYSRNITIKNPRTLTYTFNYLPANTYYFVVVAYSTSLNESAYSNEVSKTVR